MSWVTVIWSMVASACLTLGAIYGLVWYKNRTGWAYLFFSATAVSTAVFAFCELWLMRVETPAEVFEAMRWGHVALMFWLVSIVWFVRSYLGAGRVWLAWTFCITRTLYLLPSFLFGTNVNFREITSLQHSRFLGDSVTIVGGVPNPLMLFGYATNLMILIFVADAGITAWRRGDRRKALIVSGTVEFFLLFSILESALIYWAHLAMPILVSPFYLGLLGVMGYEVSRDVLRASHLVEELQESEERLNLAIDAADFGIWTRDLERNEIWATDRWRRLFGFGPGERLEFEDILQKVHPDDRAALRQAVADGGAYELEYRVLLPEGGFRWIASKGRVESDSHDQPTLMRDASRDCTARRLTEQEMLGLRHELAHVGRVSMMGQLASSLAHEINQPLGAILRNAEAAELFMQRESPDLAEVREILADIRKDNHRAGAVIDRMRALLKRHHLETRPLDVVELVRDVAALVRADAAARHVKLNADTPAGLPLVNGDRVHVQQVLLNLILNAMDALAYSGPQDRRVCVTARRDGARSVEIAVSDTGGGIPADALKHIFDPFFTTKPTGMGMGLSISHTIVEAHGGRLWAENNEDGGATFRFTLPAADAA